MPSGEIIIAAAGGGKTTKIVERALASDERSALVTFTNNNTDEIKAKLYAVAGAIPARIEVMPWFTFLLRDCVRPYMLTILPRPITGFHLTNSPSAFRIPRSKPTQFFCNKAGNVYSDKIARLACECDEASGGLVMKRLAERFGRLYIDEVQDLASWDLELVERMLKAGLNLTLIGDHRQGTFSTSMGAKNKGFRKYAIIGKFEEWVGAGLAEMKFDVVTWRCNQVIADFADTFFPDDPRTKSKNEAITGHDGVFVVGTKEVDVYRQTFKPKVLRYSRAIKECESMDAMNFGESKGLTFDRVLIYPHKAGGEWLATGNMSLVEKVVALLYVAVTRARYSVAFVSDKDSPIAGVTRWMP